MKYLDLDGIKAAFAGHLMEYRYYTPEEADLAVSDFPDTYANPYLFEDFVGPCKIDGVTYEQYASYTMLWRIGMDIPDFRFYTFYCMEDIKDHLVGEYRNAKKLYQTNELDISDFPGANEN